MLKIFQLRVIARACITRYTADEGDLNTIIKSYGQSKENNDLILAETEVIKPGITEELRPL